MSDQAPGPDLALRRYEAIHEHAELELELAGRGEIEGLLALGARWDDLTRDLPARPPAAAASLLERARLIHERTHVELVRLREMLLAEITTVGRAKPAPPRATAASCNTVRAWTAAPSCPKGLAVTGRSRGRPRRWPNSQ